LPQWLAERPGLSAGAVIERAEPLRPGDTIFTHGVVTDIYERDGDQGKLFFVVRDFEFTNQLGQSVGKLRRINIRFPESLPYDRYESSRVEALKDFRDSKRGEEISPCSTQMSLMELNRFARAKSEWGRYHMDRDFARSLALDDVLVIETLKMAYVANMLEDYFGENSWIQTLAIEYPTMDFVGDTLICHGQMVKQTVRDGQKHTECDVWIENQRGKVGTIGSAVVRLLD
jgi:acyl dehydratase